MSNNTLRTRIAQKFDLISNWSKENSVVLLKGELAFDETNRFKIGDNVHKWNDLPYAGTYALDCAAFPEEHIAQGMLVQLTAEYTPTGSQTTYTPGLYILEGFSDDKPVWTKIATGEDLSGKIAEIQAKLTEIDSAIALLQTEDANINERMESGFAALSTAQETQSAQISAIENSVAQISSDIETAIAESISTIQSDISTIQSDIDAIEENTSDLQSQIDEINANIGTVPADTTVEGQISNIIDNIIGPTTVPAYTEISGETISSKIVTINSNASQALSQANLAITTVNAVIDGNGKIVKTALPSYVDDVIEGFVGYEFEDTTANPVTTVTTLYDLTHTDIEGEGNDSVTGFFVLSSETFDINSRTESTTTKYALISERINSSFTGGSFDGNDFWAFQTGNNPITPEKDAIYVDIYTNKTYRWSGTRFTLIAADLSLGTTSETAFRGDWGKELKDIVEGTTETQGLVEKVEALEQRTENVDDYATKEELLAATAPVAESVSTLQTDLLAVNASLSEKMGTVPSGKNLQAEIEALQDLIGDLENDTIEGNTVVSSLASLKHLIDGVNADISLINNTIGVLTSDVNGNTIAEKLVTLKTALDNAQNSLGALIAQNASDISSLSEKEASDIENLAALIATLSDTVTSITTESSELEGEVDQNTSDIEEIQGKLEDANNPVPDGETVQGEINGLAAGLTALQNELETSVSDIEASEEVLANAIVEVKNDLDNKVSYDDFLILQCGGATE